MSLMSERQKKNNQGFWVIVPAAGLGARMKAPIPKQYLTVLGKPLIEHTLEALLSCKHICGIVVCISGNDMQWSSTSFARHEKVEVVRGGAERMHSVYNALSFLQKEKGLSDEFVLVHDAARPCVLSEDIEKLIFHCLQMKTGAILACPSVDTLKRVDAEGNICETLKREEVWRAQTPQMFCLSILQQSIEHLLQKNMLASDEASAVEQAGFQAQVIQGSEQNIKLTKPDDLNLIEKILSAHAKEKYTGEGV